MTPLERRRTTLRYYANCSWLDGYFGQVLDKLKKLGRLDNALIVFTADHGEMLGERNFRFSKYCLFDSSVRVPLILAGSVVPAAEAGNDRRSAGGTHRRGPDLLRAAGRPVNAVLPGLDLLGERRRAGSFCEFHGGGSEHPPAGAGLHVAQAGLETDPLPARPVERRRRAQWAGERRVVRLEKRSARVDEPLRR